MFRKRPPKPSEHVIFELYRSLSRAGILGTIDVSHRRWVGRQVAHLAQFDVATTFGVAVVAYIPDADEFRGVGEYTSAGIYLPPWINHADPPQLSRPVTPETRIAWIHWIRDRPSGEQVTYLRVLAPRERRKEWATWLTNEVRIDGVPREWLD